MTDSSTPKRVLLYDPYLDVLGGGEQHMLFVLKALEERGYAVTIAHSDPSIKRAIEHKFGIRFQSVEWNDTLFRPGAMNALDRAKALAAYDLLLTITDGSYFLSFAKHTVLYAMVPQRTLYPHRLTDRIKTYNWRIIANSRFTQSWLAQWGYQSTVHYPCISPSALTLYDPSKKQPLILSVGRFFSQLHTKKHKELIAAFKKLKSQPAFASHKLVLAGGLKQEDRAYFEELETLCAGDTSIQLMPNCSFTVLQELYTKARYFWHFTGLGVDETTHPEQVEHLGITPLEAMAAGCITCCVDAGGPHEIITNGTDGFLFRTEDELLQLMSSHTQIQSLQNMAQAAHTRVQNTFSYDAFTKRLASELPI